MYPNKQIVYNEEPIQTEDSSVKCGNCNTRSPSSKWICTACNAPLIDEKRRAGRNADTAEYSVGELERGLRERRALDLSNDANDDEVERAQQAKKARTQDPPEPTTLQVPQAPQVPSSASGVNAPKAPPPPPFTSPPPPALTSDGPQKKTRRRPLKTRSPFGWAMAQVNKQDKRAVKHGRFDSLHRFYTDSQFRINMNNCGLGIEFQYWSLQALIEYGTAFREREATRHPLIDKIRSREQIVP